uniref:ZMYM2-like/QRICH1 C-terminal domain-containing protein n=1 Tax=Amphimedon queenslandica TaxID=400682 RepID=A0A1X7TUJ9_AMPQE
MHLQKGRASAITIFNDPRLEAFHNVCDHEFHRLHQKDIGAETRQTETLSKDDENILWDTKVLDITTPAGLLNCVFFYNGKNLCLRGGDEHRQLKFSQLRHGVQKICYIYTEHGSKNRSGGLGQLHIENKVVHHFEVPEAGSRDYVKILDLYLSKLPKEAIAKDNFYVCPVSVLQEGKPWFTSIPIGRNSWLLWSRQCVVKPV